MVYALFCTLVGSGSSRQDKSAKSQKPNESAEQIGEIQKPKKSAEQIGEVGRIRPPILGGGGGLCIGVRRCVVCGHCAPKIGVAHSL